MLSYDVAEAEAVHGWPFDDELDSKIQMAMFAVDRIRTDETMHRVASAKSQVLGETCVRWAKIEHCSDIEPASASPVITDAEGSVVEPEPWSCVPGTPPISHLELTSPEGALDSTDVPLGVAAVREWELQLDEYIREWAAGLSRAMGRLESDGHPAAFVREQAAGERLIVTRHYATRRNG